MDLCPVAILWPGPRVAKRWWEQEGLDLGGNADGGPGGGTDGGGGKKRTRRGQIWKTN